MKTAIVTGAGGFIGGALTVRLLQKGVTVYGVGTSADRLQRFRKFENFVPVVADFTEYKCLPDRIAERNFDVFYHFAWQGVYGDAFRDYTLQLRNAGYACDALMQAVKLGCGKFVFAGTYNEFEVRGFMEDASYAPRYTCIYAAAKLAAELMCRTLAYQNGMMYHAGLPCMIYGENNRSEMLPNVVLRQLLKGEEPKLIEGKNYYDLVYVEDVAAAFEAIGERGVNGKSYYIGHRKLQTFQELMCKIRDIVAPEIKLRFGAWYDTSAMDYSRIDLDELYRDTGFECRADFEKSILKTTKYMEKTMAMDKKSGGGGGHLTRKVTVMPSGTAA